MLGIQIRLWLSEVPVWRTRRGLPQFRTGCNHVPLPCDEDISHLFVSEACSWFLGSGRKYSHVGFREQEPRRSSGGDVSRPVAKTPTARSFALVATSSKAR